MPYCCIDVKGGAMAMGLRTAREALEWIEGIIAEEQERRTVPERTFQQEYNNATQRDHVVVLLADPYHKTLEEVTLPLADAPLNPEMLYSRYTLMGDAPIPELANRYDGYTHIVRQVAKGPLRPLLGLPTTDPGGLRDDFDDFTTEDASGTRRSYLRVYVAEHSALHQSAILARGVRAQGVTGQKRPSETWAGRVVFVKVQELWSLNGRDHFLAEDSMTREELEQLKGCLSFRSLRETEADLKVCVTVSGL
jgi:hypothetical protein